jgi:hypothetical protein
MAKAEVIESVMADLRSLDSKLGLIAQKLRTMEKNEEVIGRTMIALNGRLKKLEEQAASGGFSPSSGNRPSTASQEDLEKKFATKQELRELRYVLDTINPLDYATITQVRDLLEEKLGALKAAKKESDEKPPAQRGAGGGASGLFKRI